MRNDRSTSDLIREATISAGMWLGAVAVVSWTIAALELFRVIR